MRDAEPVMRLMHLRRTVYQLLILSASMAEAFEPCQGGNTAALRSVFRVYLYVKGERYTENHSCMCR